MEAMGDSCESVGAHEKKKKSMGAHGDPRGRSWELMRDPCAIYGTPMGARWPSMGIHGLLLLTHGNPWKSTGAPYKTSLC